ncbi:MAG: efflux RND transporter periplasmic adaptor subunit [Fibromonadaceae bacterium]|nr:efflux RND transporter periplasmic adaptor subunit [Fibromonadaceae bacterium]
MKVRLKILIAILLLAVAIGIFCIYKKSSKNNMSLEIVYPSIGDIVQTITATGRLQPIDQVDIGTEVSGTVSKIYADFNQQVLKGQVLLEIDPLKAKVRVEQTKASYRAAANEMQYQRRNYKRIQELFQKGSVAATDMETAEYRYKNAQSNLTSAKSNLEQAELDLENCIIKSPITGIVLNRSVEAGQTVAASLSAPTLFTLARDLTQMEVKTDVDEADIGQVKAGQKVEFSVDAYPGDKFDGVIQEVRLSPVISSNVVTYTVIIKANNPNQKLLPGMTANCNIIVQEALQVLTIPMRAMQFKPDENTPGYVPPKNAKEEDTGKRQQGPKGRAENKGRVWVLESKGNLQAKRIGLGISDGTKSHVLDGLDINTPVAIGVSSDAKMQPGGAKKGSQSSNPFAPQRKVRM